MWLGSQRANSTQPQAARAGGGQLGGGRRRGAGQLVGTACSGRTWRARARVLPPQQQQGDPYHLLQVERGSSRAEVRAAYIQLIRELHPDVNPGADTTQAAAALNAAYEAILEALERGGGAGGDNRGEDDRLDVFDRPEAPPTEVFVNPFAVYNVSPLLWEQLQEAVAGAMDPEEALSRAGASFDPGFCIFYLSPEQLSIVTQELEQMSAAMDSISIEVASFFLRDCLLRARVANNRWAAAPAG